MHEMYDEMFQKWGCHGYSDLVCRRDDATSSFSCQTGKSIRVPDGPRCRVDIMEESVGRKVSKLLGKARNNFECESEELRCKMDLDGWTKCSVTGGKRKNKNKFHYKEKTFTEQNLVRESACFWLDAD